MYISVSIYNGSKMFVWKKYETEFYIVEILVNKFQFMPRKIFIKRINFILHWRDFVP